MTQVFYCLSVKLLACNHHRNFLYREREQSVIRDFGTYPSLAADESLPASADNDNIILRDLDITVGIVDKLVFRPYTCHICTHVLIGEVLLDFSYSARRGEEISFDLVSAIYHRSQCVDICRVVIDTAAVHRFLKVCRFLSHLFQTAEHCRTERAENPCGTDRAEYIGHGVAYRYYVAPCRFIGSRGIHVSYGVLPDTYHCGNCLCTGKQSQCLSDIIVEKQGDTPCHGKAYHTHDHGKQHLFYASAFQCPEEFGTHTVSDCKKEE